jgi:hypothetical protein
MPIELRLLRYFAAVAVGVLPAAAESPAPVRSG